jgi:SAM-dependent methyltransferase
MTIRRGGGSFAAMDTLKSCPACGSDLIGLKYHGKTTRNPANPAVWQMHECQSCGLGFLNPRPTWEELEPYYSAQYAAYGHSHGAKADDDAVIAEARRTGTFRHIPLPEGKRVLDVGCGGGYFLRICSKLGATVQGIEPSPIAAEQARSQGIPVFNGMIDDFKTRKKFDIITASQVLEHVPDPVATLAKMKSLLAPGGMIWLAVPNAGCRWAHSLGWQWDGADLPYHLLHFNPTSMGATAERAGLSVSRLYTESLPRIVAYSMKKHLHVRYGIPERLTSMVYSERQAAALGAKLDAMAEGDNLIVELH